MSESELLREKLIDIEREREREWALYLESKSLLEILHTLVISQNTDEVFSQLLDVLRRTLSFQDALILRMQNDGRMISVVSTSAKFTNSIWQPSALFKRVIAGQPVAVFDVNQVTEWIEQPEDARAGVKSAIHIPLRHGQHTSILICTHHERGYFSQRQLKLVHHLAPLISQIFINIDLQRITAERDRFFTLSIDMMGIVGFDGRFKQLNPAWEKILGFTMTEMKQRPFIEYVHPEERDAVNSELQKLILLGTEKLSFECRCLCKNGSYKWLLWSAAPFFKERLYYTVARDITERKKAEEKLSLFDELTGLLNRRGFLTLAGQHLKVACRTEKEFLLFFVDMDNLKQINDTFGHREGDQALIEIAQILKNTFRASDIIARLGGDEFTILALDAPHNNAETVNMRLQKNIKAYNMQKDRHYNLSISVGMAAFHPRSGLSIEELMAKADKAMYEHKQGKRKSYASSEVE